MWQGVFLPHYKFSDPPEDKRSPYLDFLIAVSEILELSESIDGRIEKLHTFWSTGQWKKEKESEGGVEAVINRFFPRFVETIPGVSVALAEEMCSLGISTANKVLSATDEELINIKGVGKTRLKKIREYCATSTKKDSDRIDLVIR